MMIAITVKKVDSDVGSSKFPDAAGASRRFLVLCYRFVKWMFNGTLYND